MSDSRRHTIVGGAYVLAAIVAWGAYFPFAKIILTTLSPTVFLVCRFGVGAVVLLLLTARFGRSLRMRRGDALIVALAGVVGIIIHQLIQVTGLKYTTATNTGWILTLIPPATGLLGWMFLREAITRRQIAGLGVAMTGVAFLVSKGDLSALSIGGNLGDLLALASVGTWSTYTIIVKSRLRSYHPLSLSTVHMIMGFVFFLAVAGTDVPTQLPKLSASDVVIVIAIGIVPSGLAYYWWNAGLARLTALSTSTYLFIEAIVASLAGHLLLGENFNLVMAGATIVIVAGVYLAQTRRG